MTREELCQGTALSDFHTYAPAGTVEQIDSIKAPSYGSNEWLFSIEWFPPQREQHDATRFQMRALRTTDYPFVLSVGVSRVPFVPCALAITGLSIRESRTRQRTSSDTTGP
jgi:hypothetical protein